MRVALSNCAIQRPSSPTFFVGQTDAGTPPLTPQAAAFACAATFEGAQAQYEPIVVATGVECTPFPGG